MTGWPITISEAAKRLRCSERWLRGHLAAYVAAIVAILIRISRCL